MTNSKLKIAFSLAFILLIANIVSVLAVNYNVEVSVGQFVKYGNFVGEGSGLESFNENDWIKIEVAQVSGKEVTLSTTGQLKNGAAIPGNGNTSIWNIETGTQNGATSLLGPIIAANLNEGDAVPPLGTYLVNKTENRVYIGDSRAVNIISSTISTPDYTTTLNFIYDKTSGMLLEANSETTTKTQPPATSQYSYSITETNIFGQAIGIPVEFLIILVVVIIIILVAVAAIALSKRSKKPSSLNKS